MKSMGSGWENLKLQLALKGLTQCSLTDDNSRRIPRVHKVKEFILPGLNLKFFLGKNMLISSKCCHSSSNWNWVYIKYKKYNHESDALQVKVYL